VNAFCFDTCGVHLSRLMSDAFEQSAVSAMSESSSVSSLGDLATRANQEHRGTSGPIAPGLCSTIARDLRPVGCNERLVVACWQREPRPRDYAPKAQLAPRRTASSSSSLDRVTSVEQSDGWTAVS
jgi:hypothetical protein